MADEEEVEEGGGMETQAGCNPVDDTMFDVDLVSYFGKDVILPSSVLSSSRIQNVPPTPLLLVLPPLPLHLLPHPLSVLVTVSMTT